MPEVLSAWPELQRNNTKRGLLRGLLDGQIYRVRRGDPEWPQAQTIASLKGRLSYYGARLNLSISCGKETADIVIIQALPKNGNGA